MILEKHESPTDAFGPYDPGRSPPQQHSLLYVWKSGTFYIDWLKQQPPPESRLTLQPNKKFYNFAQTQQNST